MPAVGFTFDPVVGEVSDVQQGTVTRRMQAGKWFVQLDGEVVTIHETGEIGRAAWVRSRLIEKTGRPTDEQWKRVGTALGRVLRRAAPEKRQLPRFLIGPVIVGALAIVGIAVIFIVRSPDPPKIALAEHSDLVWSDVSEGAEVVSPRMLKDAERDAGRKLCVEGTVDELEVVRLKGRNIHRGKLRFGSASIPFVALGSAKSIVTRYAARLCGIADGKQVVGLFDLPENRSTER